MEIVIRATITYFFLWLVIRGVGKRELAEMSAFDLILLVTIGDLVQQGVTQEDFSLGGAMLAVLTMTFWVIVSSFVQFKSPRMRTVIDGTASIIVRDGVPLDDVMQMQRLSLDDLRMQARQQGIGDLRTIELAVLEPEGKISFLTADRSGDDHGSPPEEHTT